jgi:FkbM family methyltransferase
VRRFGGAALGGLSEWRTRWHLERAATRLEALAVEGSHGVRYYVRPGDECIGPAIIRDGAFEPEKVAAVLGMLDGRGIEVRQLLDIGANIGTTTLELLRQRPSVSAVAFEPDPTNFTLLELNVIANGLRNRVRAHQLALTDRTGPVQFELADSNFGDHRVHVSAEALPNAFGENRRTVIEVPAARLDDVDGIDVGPDTLVYIDAQGFEGHVLAGAPVALARRPPLAFELWPYGLDRVDGRGKLFGALASYRELFDVGQTPPRPLAHDELEQLSAELARAPDGHTDLLALP